MSNHLGNESSPYLLQHAGNPVDWFPWGREAFEKAERENKPVFLSVGYSTCHWCHVMAHESFENQKIADILNQNFISVKVDREERPDVDSVYMSVCQTLTGSGGWPMSIFMTPQQKPFYAGTYFPPDSRYGMVGFQDLLLRIAELWSVDREMLLESSENIIARLNAGNVRSGRAGKQNPAASLVEAEAGQNPAASEGKKGPAVSEGKESPAEPEAGKSPAEAVSEGKESPAASLVEAEAGQSPAAPEAGKSPAEAEAGKSPAEVEAGKSPTEAEAAGHDWVEADEKLLECAADLFRESYDRAYGGFGGAPKFPVPHNLLFLILYALYVKPADSGALAMAEKTLTQMRRGGLFDHIGWGFSRYSTDRQYLVPHFEKMLYDNALLMIAYAGAYKAAGTRVFLDTAEKTAAYVLGEMRSEDGAFFSAQDADSEGREGRFYVLDYREVIDVLGPMRGVAFCRHYGITEKGNFEGHNIPNLLQGNAVTDEFEEERQKLCDYRKRRAGLHLDDKILTAWNSLMITAMSVLWRVSGKPVYLKAAEDACRFIDEKLSEGAVLYVSCRCGRRSVRGFLDEYAYYCAALLTLYEATGKAAYLERAMAVCGEAERQFADPDGGYFLCGTDNDKLITSPKETYDGALPSGNAVMAYCLVRLSQLTDREDYGRFARRQLAFLSGEAESYPMGHGMFLIALLFDLYPPMRITVVPGACPDGAAECGGAEFARLPLYAQIRILEGEEEGYRRLNGKTTYYVCRGRSCLPPTNELPELYPGKQPSGSHA